MPDNNDMPPAPETGAGSDDGLSRRDFVKAAMGLVGVCYAGAIGYPVYRYLATPAIREELAGQTKSVTLEQDKGPKAGEAHIFKFGSRPALLIRHKDGTYSSFDAVCTHLGCTVQYEKDKNRIHCGCHGGVYDPATGKNVSGPPPRPLTQFHVEVKDGQINISRA